MLQGTITYAIDDSAKIRKVKCIAPTTSSIPSFWGLDLETHKAGIYYDINCFQSKCEAKKHI